MVHPHQLHLHHPWLLQVLQAVAQVDLLMQLMLMHHDQFRALYPQCVKIKPHLLLHIPGLMEQFKVNLSCFVTERKHKASKKVASFAFREWCKTMMRRNQLSFFEALAEPTALEPYAMLQPKPVDWPRILGEGSLALATKGFSEQSDGLRTPSGTIHKSDLVAFRADAGVDVQFFNHVNSCS